MSRIASIVEEWKFRQRLRRLQREYYRSARKDDALIAQYLSVLADARRALADPLPPGRRALHAGSGGHRLEGWLNVDAFFAPSVDLAADLSLSIPLRSESIDYIHSEDFLEHLELAGGKRFLRETWRVLKPGGVMRILTPDLAAFVQRIYIDREREHIFWCGAQLAAEGACESFNMHMRMDGDHRFIYDETYLRGLLSSIGFSVRRVRWNESAEPCLRYLDLRDFGLSLFLEAVKPQR